MSPTKTQIIWHGTPGTATSQIDLESHSEISTSHSVRDLGTTLDQEFHSSIKGKANSIGGHEHASSGVVQKKPVNASKKWSGCLHEWHIWQNHYGAFPY